MMPLHPPGRNITQTLQEDREAVILADRLGFSEAYVGEHVTDAAETVTSSMIFLASLISETKNIMLGTGTINVPNSHPAAIAAQAAMMDHMLQGRFIMGISPGGLMSDAEVFGNFGKDRNAMFVEGINMVLKIWQSDPPYNLEGEFFNVTVGKTMIPEIGQGFIMKIFRGIRIQTKIELIIPAEFKTCLGQSVVADRGTRMTFGQIRGMRGDFVGNDAVLDVFFIGQAQVLFRCDIAKHRTAIPSN